MKTALRRLAFALLLLLAAAPARAQAPAPAAEPKFSVTRFQSAIDAFLAADRTTPPPAHAIEFIGSSIFRQWTNLGAQMAPLPVFNRAFGGSRTIEVLHYADTIVLPYAPKLIVYYCGSNDINAHVTPAAIAANFRAFVEHVHARLPATRVLYVAIIRAPQKQEHWDLVDAANALIATYCASHPLLRFVDVNPAVFDAAGHPRMELYREDKLHYHPPAYDGFTAILKPVIQEIWSPLASVQ